MRYTIKLVSMKGSPECERFLRQNKIPTDSPIAEQIREIGAAVELGFDVEPNGSAQLVTYNGSPLTVAPEAAPISDAAALIVDTLAKAGGTTIEICNAEHSAQLLGERAAVAKAKDPSAPSGNPFPRISPAGIVCASAWEYGYKRIITRLTP